MDETGLPPAKAHDKKYLQAATDAYRWLTTSNMTNSQGLYTDGYHVRPTNDTRPNTKCDERNEMVYTYNQGVLLSGMRGLWEATGETTYLDDGYALISAVINATGWTGIHDAQDSRWAGLGRGGILEDVCDASGTCSQDGQTFKGIYFHHLSLFCKALPLEALVPGTSYAADAQLADHHRRKCTSYGSWIAHNARAAYLTRDRDGQYGMWWGTHAGRREDDGGAERSSPLPEGADDYRNEESSSRWRRTMGKGRTSTSTSAGGQKPAGDLNDRGRGRTVETQGGGVAVLRAYRELVGGGVL